MLSQGSGLALTGSQFDGASGFSLTHSSVDALVATCVRVVAALRLTKAAGPLPMRSIGRAQPKRLPSGQAPPEGAGSEVYYPHEILKRLSCLMRGSDSVRPIVLDSNVHVIEGLVYSANTNPPAANCDVL